MPELSLNLDPSGGLWPVIPAAAPTPDDEPAIDFGALILIQAQPFPPVVPEPTGVSLADSVERVPAEQPNLSAVESFGQVFLEKPGFGPAVSVGQVLSEPTAVSPADPVGFTPDGAEYGLENNPEADPVVRDDSALAPEAPRVFLDQPRVSPADPVEPKPDGIEETPVVRDAHKLVPDERPAAHEEGHVVANQHRVSPERPDVSTIDPVALKPAQPEQSNVSPTEPVGLTPDRSRETPVARHLHEVVPDQRPVAPEAQRVSSESPVVSPAVAVGLKPNGSEEKPDGFEETTGVSDARPVVRSERPGAPEVRHVSSEPPVVSPVVSVGPKPAGAEEKPTGFDEKPIPSMRPTVFSHGAVSQVPQAAQPVTPAVAQAPLQAMVPTTEDGAPVMPRLVEMMRWQAQEGGGQAELRLRPEFLGAVTVSIVVEHGAVKAIVSAETPAALEYLRAESSGLQEALEERGLTLDEFEVREESPLAERRRDADDAPPRRESAPPAPRRRAPDADGEAVFNVLM